MLNSLLVRALTQPIYTGKLTITLFGELAAAPLLVSSLRAACPISLNKELFIHTKLQHFATEERGGCGMDSIQKSDIAVVLQAEVVQVERHGAALRILETLHAASGLSMPF